MEKTFTTLALLILLSSAFPHGAKAEDAFPSPSYNSMTEGELFSKLQGLMREERYFEARLLIIPARLQPNPHLEILFLSGMIYMGRADYSAAADEFRTMLARNPSLPRPRLELARALYMAGDYVGARYHFEQVLAGGLPEDVLPSVIAFLTEIREKLPTFTFGIDLVSDSNPKQSTSSKVVTLGGRTYRLDTTAPNHSVIGASASWGTRIPSSIDPTWFVRTNLDWTDYPNRDNDQTYLQCVIGKNFSVDQHTVTLEAGGHQFQYQQHKLYDGQLVKLGEFYRQSKSSTWRTSIEGKQQHYAKFAYMSGWQYVLSLENQYALSPQTRWQTGLVQIENEAREGAYAFSSTTGYFRVLFEWEGGFISGARVHYSDTGYKGIDPFFGVVRKDGETRVELDILNRNWQIAGVSPRLVVGNIKHNSNLDLYRFKRNYVRLGLSHEF